MKKISAVILVSICVLFVVSISFAQEKEIVLSEFRPTLTGHKNIAFVQASTVDPDKKVVFWRKDEPEYVLVAALGGGFWGKGAGVQIGAKGEKICFGEAHVSIDAESGFIGNLDYEGSEYTFIGKVKLLNYTFESDEKEPLVLVLVKDKGFVYVKGKGTVTTPKGDKINLGPAK